MFVRVRSPMGTKRIEIAADEKLIILRSLILEAVAKDCPVGQSVALRYRPHGRQADRSLFDGPSATSTLADVDIENGDLFEAYWVTQESLPGKSISEESGLDKVSQHTDPQMCTNYRFWKLVRSHFPNGFDTALKPAQHS